MFSFAPTSGVIPTLALLLASMLWGSSFVALKYSFQELDPLLVIFGRLLVASICFLPFVISFTRLPLRRHHILPILGLALCEPCLYFIFEAAALQRTSASQAGMITSMLPLLVVLAAGVLLGERVSGKTLLGFFLAASGAVWLTLASRVSETAPNPLLGNFLEFMAMVCATGYIILMKRLCKELPPFFLTAVQAFLGTLFFLPVLFFPHVNGIMELSGKGLAVVVYLGVFVSVGAYWMYNFGISRIPASQASAFINLIPVFSIFLGFVLLGERLSLWQVVASVVVFLGVLISQDHGSKQQES